ncbi:MAG: threonine--tRNA ligase [Patescibacteria group bacterium]
MEKLSIEIKRHSLAHIMAAAIKKLYPKVKFGIGPAIENGFYYDFDLSDCDKKTFDPQNLLKIEKEMKKIIQQNLKFEKKEPSMEEAKIIFADQPYKLELLENCKSQDNYKLQAASYKLITSYKLDDFVDLCKGPHINLTKEINSEAFKLTKIAGAYWKGDEKNPMLTRIYGIAFKAKKELDDYLIQQTEAEKRDHRKLGKELDLFHIDEMVGLGLPLWHPKGAKLWRIIENFWYDAHEKAGYDLVRSPHIGNKILWETSGHWGFYNDSMFSPIEVGQNLSASQNKEKIKESEIYLLKPMNCPFHIQIYKNNLHSYREFPFRWAECGTVYRFEKKGELSGLTRVRGFTQDDAHIICRADQVEKELEKVVDFILFIYQSFGFKLENVNVYLSTRDLQNTKYAGSDEGWNFTEEILEKIIKMKKITYQKDIGGAVFYGPKLDFKIKDVLGREWQCSTLQFDFNLPECFDMNFINAQGEKERPYVLHRALFGSFERFIGLLIEHYAGALPIWLSPVQVKIISVTNAHIAHCEKLADEFKKANIRIEIDDANETVGNKIRKAINEKIPYILVIGDKEIQGKYFNIRVRGQKETIEMTKEQFFEKIKCENKN